MTLVTAWVRRVETIEELVVASDSRLTGGLTWDQCPKLFPLSRGDGILAFAGDTAYAYPVILQVMRAIEEFGSTADRSTQLGELRGHIARLVTQLLANVRDTPNNKLDADFQLLLAGYASDSASWRIWTSRFDKKNNEFIFETPPKTTVGAVFVGDVWKEAHAVLGGRMRAGGKGESHPEIRLDWQPIDVLRDMIDGGKVRSVGGPIQMAKVYRHLAVMPYAVMHGESLSFMGRDLLSYERSQRLAFDPASHQTLTTWEYLQTPKIKPRKQKKYLVPESK